MTEGSPKDFLDELIEARTETDPGFPERVEAALRTRRVTGHETFVLGDRERDELLAMLDRPPMGKPRLRALFNRDSVLRKIRDRGLPRRRAGDS